MRCLAILGALIACGNTKPEPDAYVAPDLTVEQPGPRAVGTTRFVVHDAARGRDLVAQAWFPTASTATATPIEALEIEPVHTRYAALLGTAPACATRSLPIAAAAAPSGTFPVVVISHCHEGTRLSNASTAVRIASHGFVVITVEHLGDTLWEHLDGMDANIDGPELELRAADVRAVLDAVAANATPVSGAADLAHVGVLGHSMGAVTAARVAQLDARVGAAAALCAPVENPLTPGVTLSAITVPLLFVIAQEDNSITELGNTLARNNYRDAPVPAFKLEIPDAGHWSVSDLDGIVDLFKPGCGTGRRQTDGTDFTYLDPPTGRAIAASYATAFFKATLLDDAGARAYLETASGSFGVTLDVVHHP